MAAVGGLDASSRVCEVGIGTGRVAVPLAAHVGLLTGIDISREMLLRLLAKRGTEPCFPVQGDATFLPYPDRTFDAVVAVHVFHLIPTWREGLREIARILRPGGLLITGWNELDSGDSIRDKLFPIWAEASQIEKTRNVGVPREQYPTYLSDSGWHRQGDPRTHRFTITRTTRDYVNQLERRVWSSTWRLSDEAAARGMAAVYAAVEEHNIDLDQPVSFEGSFKVEAYTPPVD